VFSEYPPQKYDGLVPRRAATFVSEVKNLKKAILCYHLDKQGAETSLHWKTNNILFGNNKMFERSK
jgi:hypothetical protein